MNIGINSMTDLAALPVLSEGVSVHYEGSIDKTGGNADWDWFLFPEKNGEWVIFSADGPGCIYNFVQHRYISSSDVLFRFYFDGEDSPRFELRHSEFGLKYPFTEPLAGRYIGPVDEGRGPIRVVRSFVPMPFAKSCRITSDVKLEGADRALGQGGWGHVIYHRYASPDGIETFTPQIDTGKLVSLWKNTGSDPKPAKDNLLFRKSDVTIPAGSEVEIWRHSGAGTINSFKLSLPGLLTQPLHDLWLRLTWDQHETPDIYCPLGCFFGNELLFNSTRYLMMGASVEGEYYNYFPMPFWESACVTLENRSGVPISADIRIGWSEYKYHRASCGYFRSTPYYNLKHTPGADSIIGEITNSGKLVAVNITCHHGEKPGQITCEGDVRVYIDGGKTPRVESDGSESYVCYGWGFPTPPETNPSGGYDGLPDNPWSMTRLLTGGWYPFSKKLRFGIESGECNNQFLLHSGALFYYGRGEDSLVTTDLLELSDSDSRGIHGYKAENASEYVLTSCFEGDDNTEITGTIVEKMGSSRFVLAVCPENRGVVLRRRSDQRNGLQSARVLIDGVPILERNWYFADRNPHKRWLEDDFPVPPVYTAGKSLINISIEPLSDSWNESFYSVDCVI